MLRRRIKDQQNVERGKRNKRKGASFENDVAKILSKYFGIELKRTPQSGGFAKARKVKILDMFLGDIVPITEGINFLLHIECKNQAKSSFNQWFKQASEDCATDKIPVVVWHRQQIKESGVDKDKVIEQSENFVFLTLRDFCNLVDPQKVVIKED